MKIYHSKQQLLLNRFRGFDKEIQTDEDLFLKLQNQFSKRELIKIFISMYLEPIVKDIVSDLILVKNKNQIERIIKNYSERFVYLFTSFQSYILQIADHNLDDIAKIESSIYQAIINEIKSSGLLEKEPILVEKSIDFIENIADYENLTLGMTIKKADLVLSNLENINIDDFKIKISFSIIIFYCILLLIREGFLIDKKEISYQIIELGLEYSEDILAYADTLDILTDPEAMDAITKIKKCD